MQNVPFAAQQEQVNKFLQANRVLGAQMDQMQGTTRVIYDTYNMNGRSTADFFSEVASKQGTATFINGQPATNITDNRFEPGEGMVIKEIGIYNLDVPATGTTAAISTGIIGLSLLNIYIGNNRVVKDLPLFMGGKFSPINNINPNSGSTANNTEARTASFRLLTNIVIPPQVQFYANLRLPFAAVGADPNSSANGLRVYFKGYGKLFNPRNNY
jgi:hypothetical protein